MIEIEFTLIKFCPLIVPAGFFTKYLEKIQKFCPNQAIKKQ